MTKHDRYNRSAKGRARRHQHNARRIRMKAGGVQFYLGAAPTLEDAQQLRQKIKEAPSGSPQLS